MLLKIKNLRKLCIRKHPKPHTHKHKQVFWFLPAPNPRGTSLFTLSSIWFSVCVCQDGLGWDGMGWDGEEGILVCISSHFVPHVSSPPHPHPLHQRLLQSISAEVWGPPGEKKMAGFLYFRLLGQWLYSPSKLRSSSGKTLFNVLTYSRTHTHTHTH